MYCELGYWVRISVYDDWIILISPDVLATSLSPSSLPTRTLYCAKGNYEFGISRVMKSLEPYAKKVCSFGRV